MSAELEPIYRKLTCRLPSKNGWYPAIYENVYDAITSKDPSKLAVQPDQAIWTMKIIELGNKSSKEGRVIDVKAEADKL